MALLSNVSFDPKGQEIAEQTDYDTNVNIEAYNVIFTPNYVLNGPDPYLDLKQA